MGGVARPCFFFMSALPLALPGNANGLSDELAPCFHDWWHAFTDARCCEPPSGNPVCWQPPVYTYERCCKNSIYHTFVAKTFSPRLVMGQLLPTQRKALSVDLVCRTHAKHQIMLKTLLSTVNVYWRPLGWGAVVVLDADSPADVALCESRGQPDGLQPWVGCFLEELPPGYNDYVPVRRHDENWGLSKGYVRAHYGHFRFDLYSQADYVAVIDSDVVFFTFGIPGLSFDWHANQHHPEAKPKPIVHGYFSDVSPCGNCIAALELPRVAEFMPQPFIIERADFRALREFIAHQVGLDTVNHRSADDVNFEQAFNEAFLLIQKKMHDIGHRRGFTWDEVPCFQTMMAHFLWYHRHDRYAWSIKYGNLSLWASTVYGMPSASSEYGSVPRFCTCPALQVASDLGGISKASGRDIEEDNKFLDAARKYALAGLCFYCDARHNKTRLSSAGLIGSVPSTAPTCPPHSLCEQAKPVKELLLNQGLGTGHMWHNHAVHHCHPRNLKNLWEDYVDISISLAWERGQVEALTFANLKPFRAFSETLIVGT